MTKEELFHLSGCPRISSTSEARLKFDEKMHQVEKVVTACSWAVRKKSCAIFGFSASPNPESSVPRLSLEYALWDAGLLEEEPAGFDSRDGIVLTVDGDPEQGSTPESDDGNHSISDEFDLGSW